MGDPLLLVPLLITMTLIARLLLAGPLTAHALASAAYRVGIPLRQAIRDNLARAAQPTVEETLG